MLHRGWRTWKTWMMLAVLLLGLGATSAVLAQQPAGPAGPPPRGQSLLTPEDRAAMAQIFWHRTQERLGLTDQQAADIRALLDAQRAAARADVQSLMAARRQLQNLLDQPTADASAIQTAAAQVTELQAKVLDHRLQTQLAVRAKLTPEQWKQWRTLRQGMGHRGGRHRGGFGPGLM
jgi:Spy/CpxP family protein refolding chaperone